MALLLSDPVIRAADAAGVAISGARLLFYASGTTTPAPVYSSENLATPLTNPVIADSAGLFAPIYLDPAVVYRVQLLTAAGGLIRDVDPVGGPATIAGEAISAAMLRPGVAVSNIGYTPLNRAGDTAVNLLIAPTRPAATSAGYLGAPVNQQDGAYTLGLTDAGKIIRANSAAAIAHSLPPMASVALPVGAAVVFRNVGAASVTITRGAGVALLIAGGGVNKDVVLAPWGLATAVMEAADSWVISGAGLS